ncbi:MAG: hypothetical protein WD669_09375 [Pirellulales bacterium]
MTTRLQLRVRTKAGRKLLARQVAAAGRLATLPREIAEGRLVEIKHPQPSSRNDGPRVLQA